MRILLCFEFCEPAQRSQSRHEAIFTAACDDELRNSLTAFPNRLARHGEIAGPAVRANDWILIGSGSKEDAVVYPLRLNKLKLPADVCSNKCKHQPSIGAVVVEDALGK